MKIVEPHAQILDCQDRAAGVQLLRRCEKAARLSHRSEERMDEDSWDRLLRMIVLQHGDFSVVEHVAVTVLVLCDRGISHEWVRHRIGAYTQESTRFVNYRKKFGELQFVRPPSLSGSALDCWQALVEHAEIAYFDILKAGVPPQIARSVLPNSLATRLAVTYNLRMWRHFFIMRTTLESHPQMKQITIPLLQEFQQRVPILFEDLEPDRKQSESMKRLR